MLQTYSNLFKPIGVLLFLLIFSFSGAFGQEIEECGTHPSAKELAEIVKSDKKVKAFMKEYVKSEAYQNATANLPWQKHKIWVVFVDPTFSNGFTTNTQAVLDDAIAELNNDFSGTDLEFEQFDISIIIKNYRLETDQMYKSDNPESPYYHTLAPDEWRTKYYYNFDNVIVVYLNSNASGSSVAGGNIISLNWNNGNNSAWGSFSHETGHCFNLLHTFNNAQNYSMLAPPSGNTQLKLICYNNDWTFNFPKCPDFVDSNDPNLLPENNNNLHGNVTGDMVIDTHADPYVRGAGNYHPQYNSTCQYIDGYADIKHDVFDPPFDNIMSYYPDDDCGNHFTNGQINRMHDDYYMYKHVGFSQTPSYDLNDYVEYEGTSQKVKDAVVSYIFQGSLNSNFVSQDNGSITGMRYGKFFATNLYALLPPKDVNVYSVHSAWTQSYIVPGTTTVIPPKTPYSYSEWISGVNVVDIILLRKHILHIQLLPSGYKQIAANLNHDIGISVSDYIHLINIVIGKIGATTINYGNMNQNLVNPYVFVPEYVSQTLSSSFNNNPFTIPEAPFPNFISSNLTYACPLQNGKRGFDLVKMGDLNGTSFAGFTSENGASRENKEFIFRNTDVSIDKGDIVKITFKANNFYNIEGFQIGMQIKNELFDVLDCRKADLEGFNPDFCNFDKYADGNIQLLWVDDKVRSVSLKDDSQLFSLYLKAKSDIDNLKDVLSLDNNLMKTIFVTSRGEIDVDVIAEFSTIDQEKFFEIEGGKSESNNHIASILCTPNPVEDVVTLNFSLELDSKVNIVFRNTMGQELKRYSGLFYKGNNSKDFDLSNLDIVGQIFVSIENEEGAVQTTSFIKK